MVLVVGLSVLEAIRPRAGLRPGRWIAPGEPPTSRGDREPFGRSVVRGGGRVERGRREGEGSSAVADCADLLAVALSAGMTLRQALEAVGELDAMDVAPSLRSASSALRRGVSLLDVLDSMASAGPRWHAIATTLSLVAGDGTDPLPALRSIAGTERTRQRRLIERRLRRLPVLLLLPLAGLVLPAFVLVTFVPVLLSLGRSLGT